MNHDPKQANDAAPGYAGGGAWPASALTLTLTPTMLHATSGAPGPQPPDVHLVRATLDEPAPPAPLAPGVDLRVALLSALASRSILDAYGRASPDELDELHARLRANAPAVRRLTRRSLAAFLAWAEAALRPYLDDAGQAPAGGEAAR